MKGNVTQQLIEAHLVDGKMTPGDEIGLRINQTLTVFPSDGAVRQFLKTRGREVDWVPNAAGDKAGYDEKERRRFTFRPIGGVIMKEDKKIELDCSKNCKSGVQACEAEGRSRDECENRYNQCVSNCTFA